MPLRGRECLNRLGAFLRVVEDALLAALLGALILLAGAQITMRNLWESGIPWADPMLRVMVLWLGLLGAIVATRQDKHIRIDVISRYLPRRLERITRRITDLFGALVCGLLAYHSARFVRMEWEDGLIAFAGVPAWACELILPVGFALIAARFLILASLGPVSDVGQRERRT